MHWMQRTTIAIVLFLISGLMTISCQPGPVPVGEVVPGLDILEWPEFIGSPGDGITFNSISPVIVNQRFENSYRRCVEFPDDRNISVRLPADRPDGRFEFSVAVSVGDESESACSILTALVTGVGDKRELTAASIENGAVNAWHDLEVELDGYDGQAVRVDISVSVESEDASVYLGNPYVTAPSTSPNHVILICVDTLRADHLGVYGCERGLTPGLDSLSRESVRFENCIAPSPWTLPAIASAITGRYPGSTGADSESFALREEETTIAELYRDAGYRTASIISNAWISRDTGFFQGYESEYHQEKARADEIFDRAFEYVEAHMDENFFLFVHFMDPHAPYDPPEPYLSEHRRGRGRFTESFDMWGTLRGIGFSLREPEREQVRGLYDGCVAFFDAEMDRFVQGLKEWGTWDETVFVLFGDHGEEFWEHGGGEHGHSLYQEVAKVPLIMNFPGQRATVREAHVSLVDIVPTMLGMSGIDIPEDVNGIDLFARSADPDVERLIFSEELFYGDEQKAVVQEDWKLIANFGGHGNPMLFNLVDDPGELHNVAANEPQLTDYLYSQLLLHTVETSQGYHVRVYPSVQTGGGEFTVTIEVQDGTIFDPNTSSVWASGLTEEFGESSALVTATIAQKGHLAIDFMVDPEDAEVTVAVEASRNTGTDFSWYLGASTTPVVTPSMTFRMTDPRIAWSHPQTFARQSDGIYVWAYPPGIRQELEDAVSPETLEELRSLGYLH